MDTLHAPIADGLRSRSRAGARASARGVHVRPRRDEAVWRVARGVVAIASEIGENPRESRHF